MEFRYCPLCGTKLDLSKTVDDEGIVPFCPKCQKFFFGFNYTCVMMVCYTENGEVIFIKQKNIPTKRYVLVAGYIKSGMTAEETVKEEIIEEIGLVGEIKEYLGSFFHEKSGNLMLAYSVLVHLKEMKLSDELNEAVVVKINDGNDYLEPNSLAKKVFNLFLERKKENESN